MEAAVVNLLSSGESAVYVDGGKFGERWGEILRRYGVTPLELKVEWGRAVDPELIKATLTKHREAKAIFLTHSETSTGTAIDLKRVAEVVRNCSDALIVVDGITSVGALELQMDEWGVDAVITGSQKGLMLPPGLSFIALSQRAWKAASASNLPKFYLDLDKAQKTLKEVQTPWTPGISLIVGLDVALQMIRDEDLRNVWTRHERLARGLRQGCAAFGLETLSSSPSNALTALRMPQGMDGEALRTLLREKHGVIVAGGQDHLKRKIIRIAHLGYFDELDIITAVAALGMAVRECLELNGKETVTSEEYRKQFDLGAGVYAVLQEFSKPFKQEFQLRYLAS
jgi:aspartate aminotransferase-like enzyme